MEESSTQSGGGVVKGGEGGQSELLDRAETPGEGKVWRRNQQSHWSISSAAQKTERQRQGIGRPPPRWEEPEDAANARRERNNEGDRTLEERREEHPRERQHVEGVPGGSDHRSATVGRCFPDGSSRRRPGGIAEWSTEGSIISGKNAIAGREVPASRKRRKECHRW